MLTPDIHPREIRDAFLTLFPGVSPGSAPAATLSPRDKTAARRGKSISEHRSAANRGKDNGEALAIAKAATILPGDYAVMRNVMSELRGRLGRDWLGGGRGLGTGGGGGGRHGGVVEVSGGFGPGVW